MADKHRRASDVFYQRAWMIARRVLGEPRGLVCKRREASKAVLALRYWDALRADGFPPAVAKFHATHYCGKAAKCR